MGVSISWLDIAVGRSVASLSVGILVEVLIGSAVIVDELIAVACGNGRVTVGLRSENLRLRLRDVSLVVAFSLGSEVGLLGQLPGRISVG